MDEVARCPRCESPVALPGHLRKFDGHWLVVCEDCRASLVVDSDGSVSTVSLR